MSLNDSKIVKIQTQFQTLSAVASSLNAASDDLTKVVGVLDEALKKLNVGLTVWVTFSRWSEEDRYSEDQIGYCKINGKWGIALLRIYGDHSLGEEEERAEGPWLFNDAPREMRLLGVDKIPDVIEALNSKAHEAAKKIKEKTEEVREIAAAVTEIHKLPKATVTHTVNLSSGQVEAIREGVRQTNKFTAELLDHALVWERREGELRIRFPFEKSTFAELLKGTESTSRINAIANQVLEPPMKLVVDVEPARFPREADNANPGTKKGRK